MNKETGGSAFPEVFTDETWSESHQNFMRDTYSSGGMTLRDYFAAHAPEPLDSDIEFQRQLDRNKNPYNESYKPKIRGDREIRAALRYEFADAMLEARK